MPKKRPPLTDEDGEVRELTREDFRLMRPIAEVDPGMLDAIAEWRESLNKGGRPKSDSPKAQITFRLSADLIARIRATGPGYNARVEKVLRDGFGPKAARSPRAPAARKRA